MFTFISGLLFDLVALRLLKMPNPNSAGGTAPQPDPQRAVGLSKAALLQFHSFLNDNSEDFLNRAIDTSRQSLALTPKDDPALAARFLDLAEMIRHRYERSAKPEDLIEGIDSAEKAYSLMPRNHKYFPDCAWTWALLRDHQYQASETVSFINDATEKIQEALECMPNSPVFLQAYGTILAHRYESLKDLKDLQNAIDANQKVIFSNEASQEAKLFGLSNLAILYAYLYERELRGEHLDVAVQMAKQVERETRSGHPERPNFLGILANVLRDRFDHKGQHDDLKEAIKFGEDATQSMPGSHPHRAKWLNNLGLAYESQFECTGDMGDLELAINATEEAIVQTPQGHPGLLRRTNNLANQLGLRYEWTRETEYMKQAIEKLQDVADRQELGASDQCTCLNNLAYMLIRQFEREGNAKDLDEAIERSRESLFVMPQNHPNRPMHLNILGLALRLRYEQLDHDKDIDKAIQLGEDATKLASGSPYRATWLSNLGISFIRRYGRTNREEDLERAIKVTEESVQSTPEDLPDRAIRLSNLANMLQVRSVLLNKQDDVEAALRCSTMAAESSTAVPLIRVKAARNAIRILQKRSSWEQMRSLAQRAIQILPLVCGRYLSRQDQQHAVIETSGLAADVCSILLNTEDTEEALRRLEFGRGLVIGYVIDNRDNLSALKADHSDLAQRYEMLRSKISQPIDIQASNILETRMRERRAAIYDIEKCLQQIRQLNGHEKFLRALGVDELKACADEGPIVVVNFTDISSDAILVSASEVRRLQLPGMLMTAPEFVCRDMRRFGSFKRDLGLARDMESEVENHTYAKESFLTWLWRTCVKVVLQELEETGMVNFGDEIPRIWWIGTGIAASYPFHAAQSSSDGSEENALSRMIPSYTPSIKALAYSREKSRKYTEAHPKGQKVVIVTMPTTPGQKPLKGVEEECAAIQKACNGIYTCSVLRQPTAEAVLESIGQSSIVHFACHGLSHKTDPSNSHLLLQKDGESGPVVDELTVSKIFGVDKSGSAWISYLSACSTAEVKDSKLADEGIHISSVLQIAGFAHVIGSLWSVEDKVCVHIAKNFYEALIQSDGNKSRNRAVAQALRSAVLQAKRSLNLDLHSWGAYIHSGA